MHRLKLQNFYVRSSLFSVLTLAAAVLNYLLYPVLAHVFNAQAFGDFTAILAMSNQVMGILIAFNVVSIYLVKKYPEDEARLKAQIIQRLLLWFFAGATLVVLILSPTIRHYLHINDLWSLPILSLLMALAVPTVIWTGYLQGHKQLIRVGLFGLYTAALKVALCVLLANVWGVRGGVLGIALGMTLGLVLMWATSRLRLPNLLSTVAVFSKAERAFIKQHQAYILSSVFVVGMLSILQNVDITFAKILFAPQTAGIYSGISIISNALYYVSFILIWILLPELSIDHESHNRRILGTAYKLLALVGLGAVAIEIIFHDLIAVILLGRSFESQALLLIFASIFQLLVVGSTLYAYYLLALRKPALLFSSCVFASVILVPIILRPSNPAGLIISLGCAVLFGLAFYGIIKITRGVIWYATKETTA